MFEKATKMKLRFPSSKGLLTTEDLWDLPLVATGGKPSLDNVAKTVHRAMKDSDDESFVNPTAGGKLDDNLELQFNIVKSIIATKLAAKEKAEKSAATRQRNERIRAIIAEKEDSELMGASLEELKGMLEA